MGAQFQQPNAPVQTLTATGVAGNPPVAAAVPPVARGARAILSNKVKLGADASAAAGPKGRTANASTDVSLRAEVLSYSRARGLFAGLSLEGSTVRPDNDANERIYGKKIEAESIVFKGAVAVPPAAQKMIAYLNQKSPKNLSDPESLK